VAEVYRNTRRTDPKSRLQQRILKMVSIFVNEIRLWGGDVYGICENPKRPTPPACKTGLAQENFRSIAPGARNGFVDRSSLLLIDFMPITKNLD
jgi:hypothetical protein